MPPRGGFGGYGGGALSNQGGLQYGPNTPTVYQSGRGGVGQPNELGAAPYGPLSDMGSMRLGPNTPTVYESGSGAPGQLNELGPQQNYGIRTGFADPHNVWGGANMYGFNPPMGGAFGQRMARFGPFPGNLGFGWGRGPMTYDPHAFLGRGFGLFGHGWFHPGGFGGFGPEGRFNRFGSLFGGGGLGGLFSRFGRGGADRGPYGGYRGWGASAFPNESTGFTGGGWGPGAGLNIGGYLPGGYGFNPTGTPTGPYGSNYTRASAFVDNNASTVTNYDPASGGTGWDQRR